MVTQFTHHPLVNVVLSTIRDCGHHISIKHAYPVLASYLITGFCIAVHDAPPWPLFSHTIPHLVFHPVRSSLRFNVAPLTTDQNELCIDFDCYLSFIKAATEVTLHKFSMWPPRSYRRSCTVALPYALSSFIPPVLNITPPLLPSSWHNRDVPLGFKFIRLAHHRYHPQSHFPEDR